MTITAPILHVSESDPASKMFYQVVLTVLLLAFLGPACAQGPSTTGVPDATPTDAAPTSPCAVSDIWIDKSLSPSLWLVIWPAALRCIV